MSTLKAATAAVSVSDSNLALRGDREPIFPNGHEGDFRAVAVALQADEPLLIITCDGLTLPNSVLEPVRARLTAATGLPATHMLLVATHTHSGLCTLDIFGMRPHEEFVRRLQEAMVQAGTEAWEKLHDSSLTFAQVQAELLFAVGQEATVGRNSRLLLKDGQVGWFGYEEEDAVRPTGPYDPDLLVLALRRPRGELAALLFNHSVHNIGSLEPGARSPAFYGLTAQGVEQAHAATTMFLPGAFGSTHNITWEGSGVPSAECVTRMTAAIEETLSRAAPAMSGPLRVIQRPFTYRIREFDEAQQAEAVSRYFARYATEHAAAHIKMFADMRVEMIPAMGQERQTTLMAIRLGQVALVGIPGEYYAKLGLELRRRSPFRHTFIIGLANEEIGYIPDREAYEVGGYQTWAGWHCQVAPGTGEAMIEQALEMLHELAAEPDTVDPPVLRQLGPDDALALQTFYNHLSPEVRWRFAPLGWCSGLTDCLAFCRAQRQGERYDVVLDNGREIVGWAFVSRLNTPRAYLGIGIADRYCSQGLGKVLMQAVCDEARRLGKEAIDLIVIKSNERAQKLYERFGFVRTGERPGQDGQEFYEMVATLTP